MTSQLSFSPLTTEAQVIFTFPNQIQGKPILITGVSPCGLGSGVARAIASQAPSLIVLAGRTEPKVKSIIDDIGMVYPSAPLRFLKPNISLLDSLRMAAAEVNAYPEEEENWCPQQ